MRDTPTPLARPDLEVTRVRHPVKFRLIQVKHIKPLSSTRLSITFTGEDLQDFVSESFDDHVKLFFPEPGQDKPVLPISGAQGPEFPPGQKPVARDYTPRRFDRNARELEIEFTLHDAGPATTWAAQASLGQYLGVGGPKGSMRIPAGFDWHVLVGDETALPAIARRLEELPSACQVTALLLVENLQARSELRAASQVSVEWYYRSDGNAQMALLQRLQALQLTAGEGYAWVAGESGLVRAAREVLIAHHGIDKRRIRAASYWKNGAQGVHEKFND